MKPRGTAKGAPMRAPSTAVSAFQRRASAHFLRRPRMWKIATSVITRVYAEKAAQKRRPSLARCSPASPSLADIKCCWVLLVRPERKSLDYPDQFVRRCTRTASSSIDEQERAAPPVRQNFPPHAHHCEPGNCR